MFEDGLSAPETPFTGKLGSIACPTDFNFWTTVRGYLLLVVFGLTTCEYSEPNVFLILF